MNLMRFWETLETALTFILDQLGLAWWIEIVTVSPCCVYYFGPFAIDKQAEFHQRGYLEDLQTESAGVIAVNIKQCKPPKITVCEEDIKATADKNLSEIMSRVKNLYEV